MFMLSPRNIFVSLAINVVARYKVYGVAKLGDTEREMFPKARPCLTKVLSDS